MIWKPCPGIGQPSVKSQEWGGKAMCPVCTMYVTVPIGARTPDHNQVVIESRYDFPVPSYWEPKI